MATASIAELVNAHEGLVSRQIFMDKDIYRQELERVFTRCWLFLGHESQIKEPGDYFTNYMGEDPVVVCRDAHGKVRAFLNSCLHRGMKVCRTDSGNAKTFTCSYHGWTYTTEGKLSGVPFERQAYNGELDRERWGLKEVPQVKSYGGLIFGCWDAGAISLDTHLGELRWYLDVLLERPRGGLEVIPGVQKYVIPGNWKIGADNFAGDNYHVMYAHGSGMKLETMLGLKNYAEWKAYTVTFAHGHGICDIFVGDEAYETDLAAAKQMGPEVAEYVEESRRRLQERLSARQAKVYAFGVGNIFPNFSLNDFSVFFPNGFYLWHPKGPDRTEVWQWCAVDRDAPQVIKDIARTGFTRTQSAGGIFGQDDSDNFEQVTEATRGVIAQQCSFNYQMGLGHEGETWVEGYPGRFGPRFSEQGQRNFYAHWLDLMNNGHER